MLQVIMSILKDIKLLVITVLLGVLIILTIKVNGLNDELTAERQTVANLKVEVVDLKAHAKATEEASKIVEVLVKNNEVVIEKKVVEIQKEYVPQIEYVDRFIKVKDETDCEASNRLFNSIVY